MLVNVPPPVETIVKSYVNENDERYVTYTFSHDGNVSINESIDNEMQEVNISFNELIDFITTVSSKLSVSDILQMKTLS